MEGTVDTTYEGVYMSFNTDIISYVPSLKKKTPGKYREVKRTLPKPNLRRIRADNRIRAQNGEPTLPLNLINPEFQSLIGQGYKPLIDFPYPYNTTISPTTDTRETSGRGTVVNIRPITTRTLSPDPDIEVQVQQAYDRDWETVVL